MAFLDPSISFTPSVIAGLGRDSVIVVKDAKGAKGIRSWYKDYKTVQGRSAEVQGELYERLLASVQQGIKGREIETVTFLWMQGEQDAATNQTGVYKQSLDAVIAQLQSDLKIEKMNLVLGRLSDYSLDTGKHPEWPQMRDLQQEYAESKPYAEWVNTDDLNNMTHKDTGAPRNDVHYTREGYEIFGDRLAEKALGLLAKQGVVVSKAKRVKPPFEGKHSDFKGYDMYKFKINNNQTKVQIVCPKKPAEGKPWLWRSLFWEALDKVNAADLKLVDEGYHVVLVHGDVSGHPKGNVHISAAYDYLTQTHGFAKTFNMASMSRGTLSLFTWAHENPEKVNSIYVDNGVCNVLSWPAGKSVVGGSKISNGEAGSWARFKKVYGYATDAEAVKSKHSPIDLLEPLAKAQVPILLVCGSKDKGVPYEENDAILEERYKAFGGPIEVIIEEKGHSHGMKDPTPVLEFIKKHSK